MGNPVLARYSIRSKQAYIFKTNRLVEIVGASMIIADAFDVLFRCANQCPYHCERNETPVKFDLADVLRRFGDKSLDMLELYTGGGNCTVLYRDMDVCRNVNMSYTRQILEDFPGLLPMYAGVELDGTYRYDKDIKRLQSAEETEKNRMFPARGGYALPFSKMDRVTFQPLKGSEYVGGQSVEFSAESLSKRQYERDHNRSQEGRSLDDIGNLLAIVHADGNNMGLKIHHLLDGKTDYDECVSVMREFTQEIRDVYKAGRAALNAAYQAVPRKDGETHYPIRWIVSEGDDATFICNAKYAERLTEAYLRGVRDYRAKSGETYSACAGISVFHAHYPCSRAYAVAEQACDNAKKPVHDSAAKGTPSEDGWLDFHIIQSGVGGDLNDLRLLWRLTEERGGEKINRCIMRPWQVCGTFAAENRERDIRKLAELADVLSQCGVTRGNLVTLGAVIESDPEQGRLEWERICYRNDLRLREKRNKLKKLRTETAKLYKDWASLSKALYDLSDVFDIWYGGKEAAE